MNMNFDSNFLLDVISEAPYGVLVFGKEGKVLLENELASSILSDKKKSVVGTLILDHFDVFDLSELLTQVLEGERERFDIMEMVFGEKVLTIRCRRTKEWSILTVQDITRWKNIEMVAVQSIIETQENERRRIALEIHDGIGPQLSSTILQLETISERIKVKDPETAKELQSLSNVSNEVADELRSISHSLMPRVLLDFGLEAALRGLINRINAGSKCKVEFISSFTGESIDQTIELNLYRIAQELTNNALKHAKATSIFVQLLKNGRHLTLMVEDNGEGFNISELKNAEGIGLSNIEMRTKVLGGELNIDSSPGRGSVITVEVLLNEH